MSQTEATISNLIQSQFPAFYNDEGPVLVAFMEAYYEWMEQTGNPIARARSLQTYADIDTTLEEFVVYFTNTYLQGIQFNTLSDKRLTVKKILDLYRAKGNIRALKLLFQLVFKEDIDVYLPAEDILKPSDGVWTVPEYLEISYTSRNTEYLGKTISGVTSGATAFVDRIVRRKIESKFIDLFFITNVSENDFITGEQLNVDNNLINIPTVIGSLSGLIVDEGGYGFSVGDIVNLSSAYGLEGTGRVASTSDVTGIVNFTLLDGGWGFSNVYANVIISNTVLYLSSINSTLPKYSRPIEKFSNVVINIPTNPSANLYVNAFAYSNTCNVISTPVAGTFLVNETVVSADGYANGKVTSVSTASYPLLTLSNYTGPYQFNETVYQPNADVSPTANLAVGKVLAVNTTTITVAVSNGTFVPTLSVKGLTSSANANVAVSATSITTLGVANVYESYFGSNSLISGVTSGATANVIYINSDIGITGLSGSLSSSYTKVYATYPGVAAVTSINGTILAGETVYQNNASTNIATGTVLGVNATAITLQVKTGAFVPTAGVNTGIQVDTSNAAFATVTGTGTLTNSSNNVTAFSAGLSTTKTNSTLTNGSANINVSSATGIVVGQAIYSPVTNFANGIYVTSIVGTTVVSSAVFTGTTTTTADVTFSNIAINSILTSTTSGLVTNTQVYSVNTTHIVLKSQFGGTTTAGAALTFTEMYGTFIPGETVYQNDGVSNVATGFLIGANATHIVYNTTTGTFVTSTGLYEKVIGGVSGASASIASIVNNPSSANATITSYTPVQTVNATLTGYSSGINANIALGSINSTETVFYYTDNVGGKNIAGAPYLLLPLNALSFGFPKNPGANASLGYLVDMLSYQILQVGQIQNITITNPGKNYNRAPYVEIYQNGVATAQKRDYVINISNLNGGYTIGEQISQNVALTSISQLVLNTPSGAFSYPEAVYQINSTPTATFSATAGSNLITLSTGATTNYAVGQQILIGNSDIRTISIVTAGVSMQVNNFVYTTNTSANADILKNTGIITNIVSTNVFNFSNTGTTAWVATQNVYGLSSKSTSQITSVQTSVYGTAQGKILSANSSVLSVRRNSINQDFGLSSTGTDQLILGQLSGATSNATAVSPNTVSNFSGDNADIPAKVVTASGTVSNLYVQSSGIGYVNAESVVFTSQDGTKFGIARTVLGKQGVGQGYYSSTKGFTSDDKYIQDGYFYQNFSYEIKSSLDISRYYTMVKDVVHTSGTNLYGAVIKKSTAATLLNITNSNTGPIVG